jgi:hypothetical protein
VDADGARPAQDASSGCGIASGWYASVPVIAKDGTVVPTAIVVQVLFQFTDGPSYQISEAESGESGEQTLGAGTVSADGCAITLPAVGATFTFTLSADGKQMDMVEAVTVMPPYSTYSAHLIWIGP